MSKGSAEASALRPVIGIGGVFVTAVSYVIATTSLVSDFSGWFRHGIWFAVPLAVALGLNAALALSVSELCAAFPRAGAVYSFTASVLAGSRAARSMALFTALSLFGMVALGGVGEIFAGALSLHDLLGAPWPLRGTVALLLALAVLPNLWGIVCTTQVSLVALILLLLVRWLFGVIGFAGWSPSGPWSWQNVLSASDVARDMRAALTAGLGFAFWSCAGIEFVAPLAEEVRDVPRVFPRGMLLALAFIVLTSIVMGLGVSGTLSPDQRQQTLASAGACAGNCVHLAVGELMLGAWGRKLMALGAVASTYGTLAVGIGALARIAYGVAGEARLSERLTEPLRRLSGTNPTPRTALLITTAVCAVPAMFAESVVDWILPSMLLWVLVYATYHLLVLVDRQRSPERPRQFRAPRGVPFAGLLGTLLATRYVLPDDDGLGLIVRAIAVLVGAALLTLLLSRGAVRSQAGAAEAE